ncbi:MAG TPA: hypothetical protein VG095_07555, partial [Chthoniobacterales bacterium]|nr:hypothetical protein [Chthoniobacterales bacterium]
GFIFAAGTMVGLLRSLTSAAFPAWLCFACLCSLNCISIAVWERDLDHAQGRVSIATAFPRIVRLVLPAMVLLSIVVVASGWSRLNLCIATSAMLLLCVHVIGEKIQADIRTALADLVLLTPLVVLPFR